MDPVKRLDRSVNGRTVPRESTLCGDHYRILDFSLIVSPSTMNLPYP